MELKPVVSVCMITYAHENFIREAIEGVLMQECDFEVELIVVNDCSPDHTDEVIHDILQKHPRASWIKYVKHETNIGMMPNFVFALQQCKGKYIALCEGDDYWVEPLKLQKQVSFLNKNNNYSSCFTDVNLLKDNMLTEIGLRPKHKKDSDSISVFYDLWIPTLTLVFRRSNLVNPLPKQFLKVYNGDLFLFYLLAQEGKIGYLDIVSSVYRQHENGAWSGLDILSKTDKQIISFGLIRDYFYQDKRIRKILSNKIMESKWSRVNYFFKKREVHLLISNYLLFLLCHPKQAFKKGYKRFKKNK